MRRVAATLLVLTACVQSSLVPCGDLLCPVGSVCTTGNRCATGAQIAACDGLAEGASCTVSGGVGRCEVGVCVATGCGNGVIDTGETCDDGNATSGDGCRSDCGKVELCGDGVTDDREGCDDGNTNAADGCDACAPTLWHASALIGGGTLATEIALSSPGDVAVDRAGNVYIAEFDAHRVRRVDPSGVTTVVAGTGVAGFSGDGGPATSAQFNSPGCVAVDGLGNLFVCDNTNRRVRMIDTRGVIRTFAGNGVFGSTGDGGPATSASVTPQRIAVDGLGNVLVSDAINRRVRKVSLDGTIATFAGCTACTRGDGGPATAANLVRPSGVALDAAGNVYISDLDEHTVRRVDAWGVITTVAGVPSAVGGDSGDGGPATQALLATPISVTVDAQGSLYIANLDSSRIRRVDAAGAITAFAGTGTPGTGGDGGPATSAQLERPAGIALDPQGRLVLVEAVGLVRRVDATGVITTIAGAGAGVSVGDGGAATSAVLVDPTAVAVDAMGRVYISGPGAARIRRIELTGTITTIAGTGVSGFSGDGGPAKTARIMGALDLVFDAQGNLYFTDVSNQRVRKIDAAGAISTIAGTGTYGYNGDGIAATTAQLASPNGLAIDSQGNVLVADWGNHRIRSIAPSGLITTIAGTTSGLSGDGGPATAAQLSGPRAVAVDAAGRIYIADTTNHRVRRIDAGTITTFAGSSAGFSGDGGPATSAQLQSPMDVVIDPVGRVVIDDVNNARLRRVDSTGTITTIAGTATVGGNGDGGPASAAELRSPVGLVCDSTGALLIGDLALDRVREIEPSGRIITVAGAVAPEGMGLSADAHLADPRALVVTPTLSLIAGGATGTVQAVRPAQGKLEVVSGRYPQATPTGSLARFRSSAFGTVEGVAYDPTGGKIYVTESSAHRIHVVTPVDLADARTWTIAPLAGAAGSAGFADGPTANAQFRSPTGLWLDTATHTLYVADTGNHVVRAIDLVAATVRTVAGTPAIRGYFGDAGLATSALLYAPRAITRCANGDLFVADTGNHRVRRIADGTATISTVLGDGVAASSGEGAPASTFPVDAPLGLGCDAIGNLYVTSSTSVRQVVADAAGSVDGTGGVRTIYGAAPRREFPASTTGCLTGLAVVDATHVQVVDSCSGLLVELQRTTAAP